MQISQLLKPENVHLDIDISSKKRLLERVAEDFSELCHSKTDHIFSGLLDRERLGSTGLGHGIAIPHTRMSDQKECCVALFRLSKPVDFDAQDREPVDLVFSLLIPEQANDEHLQILASLARLLSNPEVPVQLRQATEPEQFLNVIQSFEDA